MALDVRLLGPNETAILERVADDVFDDPLVPAAAAEFLRDPRHQLAVAIDDGVVVGFASAVLYVHPDKARPELWINEVGVAGSHQRRGIGRRLMSVLLDTARAANCSVAWVLTEESNSAAKDLYAAAGGQRAAGCQVMFDFPLDEQPAESGFQRRERPATVTVRAANFASEADAGAIVEVLDMYAREPIAGARPLSADVRARLPGALRSHPAALAVLAFAADAPVGVAVCFEGVSTFHARPLLNVHDLAVVPAWRGRGVGCALLEAVEAEAVRRGCCRLTLEVQEDNDPARRLYERFGFTDYLPGGAPTRFLCKPLG